MNKFEYFIIILIIICTFVYLRGYINNHTGKPLVWYAWDIGSGEGQRLLRECEGDCDNDSECEGNLKCFHRTYSGGLGPVPGCRGVMFQDADYCYDPTKL